MKKYAVKNCPCCHHNSWNTSEGMETGYVCYHSRHFLCKDCTDCLIKQIIDGVSTVYKTPDYFETIKDEKQSLIESVWHNVAHMVMSKVEIEEYEE